MGWVRHRLCLQDTRVMLSIRPEARLRQVGVDVAVWAGGSHQA
jgi:hypothetical protein